MGQRLVGDDHCDSDRDQCLPKLLTLIPAKEELLHHEADDAYRKRGDHERDDPIADTGLRASEGRRGVTAREAVLQVEGEEAGEHVERPMSHVHDPHQSEDEREAARDHEIETRECDAVQGDDDEDARVL